MAKLTPNQREYYYILEAERSGIQKSILAALYEAQQFPILASGESGLGIVATNQSGEVKIDSFHQQVQLVANAIRTLINNLIAQGWKSYDLWSTEELRYSDRLLEIIADGYIPAVNDSNVARLEACDYQKLQQAYLQDWLVESEGYNLLLNLAQLDRALLAFTDRVAFYYKGLRQQRDALIEALRLWHQLDTCEQAIATLIAPDDKQTEDDWSLKALTREAEPVQSVATDSVDLAHQDSLLKDFSQNLALKYSGFPHQREALIRLVQLWQQLTSRMEAIASVANNNSAEPSLQLLDPALLNFTEQILLGYEGKGVQRQALTEAFRVWNELDSRTSAVEALGIDPNLLVSDSCDQQMLRELATKIDRELLIFIRRVSADYRELTHQREALMRLFQLWRGIATRNQVIELLTEQLQLLEREHPVLNPISVAVPLRPQRWTTTNIQLSASIIPDGSFTWAQATHGGTCMPTDQATIDAILRMAYLLQRARHRIGHPFLIINWYRPCQLNQAETKAFHSRHLLGDAVDFVCDNLTGNQIYWQLDPWWSGGLARYQAYPYLCHLDARGYRARWTK